MNEKKKLRRLPKRILSLVLTLVMVLTLMPISTVWAKTYDTNTVTDIINPTNEFIYQPGEQYGEVKIRGNGADNKWFCNYSYPLSVSIYDSILNQDNENVDKITKIELTVDHFMINYETVENTDQRLDINVGNGSGSFLSVDVSYDKTNKLIVIDNIDEKYFYIYFNETLQTGEKPITYYISSAKIYYERIIHEHDWKYSIYRRGIRAKCEGIGTCPQDAKTNGVMLYLDTESRPYSETDTYDGATIVDEKNVEINSTTTNLWTSAGLAVPEIKYYTSDDQEVTNLTALPAGQYYATVTMGTGDDAVTISDEFAIVAPLSEEESLIIEKVDNNIDDYNTSHASYGSISLPYFIEELFGMDSFDGLIRALYSVSGSPEFVHVNNTYSWTFEDFNSYVNVYMNEDQVTSIELNIQGTHVWFSNDLTETETIFEKIAGDYDAGNVEEMGETVISIEKIEGEGNFLIVKVDGEVDEYTSHKLPDSLIKTSNGYAYCFEDAFYLINFTFTNGICSSVDLAGMIVGYRETPSHEHVWEYSLVGTDTIKAHCKTEGHEGDDVTLTLTATSPNYSGSAVTASYGTGEADAWKAAIGTDAPKITYEYKATADGTYASTEDTTKIGYYRASATVDTDKTATVEFQINKLSQEAPTVGVGFTIDYSAETITAETGYEVSTSNETFTAPVDGKVSPGTTYYVRKVEDATHEPSDWMSNSVSARPEAPANYVAVDTTTAGGKDGKITGVAATMEYSVDNGTSWNAVTGTEITGLSAGTVLIRVKATASSFAGTNAEATITDPHTHTLGRHHEAVPGNCVDKGTLEYYDCADSTCDEMLDKDGNELTSIEGTIDATNHKGTASTWTKTATTHKETYDCCDAVKTAEAEHMYGTTGAARYTCTVCSYENTTKKAEAELADAKTEARVAIDTEVGTDESANVKKAADDAKSAIEAATTIDAVTTAKEAGIEAIKAAKASNAPTQTPTSTPVIPGPTVEPTKVPTVTPAPTSAPEEYTIPVKGDESAVNVDVKITDGTAVISEITEEKLEAIVQEAKETEEGSGSAAANTVDTITIDLSGAKQKIEAATLSTSTIEILSNTLNDASNTIDKVEVKLSNATVVFDAQSLDSIAEQAKGKNVTLVVEEVDGTALNKKQLEALKNYNVTSTFDVYLISDNEKIHMLDGGHLEFNLEFKPEKNTDPRYYHVVYVAENGDKEYFDTEYVNGNIKFTTPHCSNYVIVYDESRANNTIVVPGKKQIALNNKLINVDLLSSIKSGKLTVQWSRIDGAMGYDVFVAPCDGSSYGSTPAYTASADDSKAVLKKYNGKSFAKGFYKIKVRAFVIIDGKKTYIATSSVVHTAGNKTKYTNAKKVTVKDNAVKLLIGENAKVEAGVTVVDSKKKIMKHMRGYSYFSLDKAVATVDKNGKIVAKGAGTTTIYAMAANGVKTAVEVTVE